jgi:NAD(P)H dehydrogenase (quinone)
MKHLIVYAHPHEESFSHALLETTKKTLEDKGDDVIVRNLYEIGFDPTLSAKDFASLKNKNIPEDIAKEQQYIIQSDTIIFIYPLWWVSMPAILKGYVDRVFSYGFAYRYNENGNVEGLLKGKKAFIVSTQGTPTAYYDASGMSEAFRQTIDIGIFNFCNVEVAGHICLGEVPSVTQEKRVKMLEEIRDTLLKTF